MLESVAHLVAPAVRSVDDVEQSATHHHCAEGLGALTKHFPVDLVVAFHLGGPGIAASAQSAPGPDRVRSRTRRVNRRGDDTDPGRFGRCTRAVDLHYFRRPFDHRHQRAFLRPCKSLAGRRPARAFYGPFTRIGYGHRTGSKGLIRCTCVRSIAVRSGLRCRVALPRRSRRAPHRSRSFPVRSRAPVVWWPLPGSSLGRSGEPLRGCVG
jgi:hypothetical protein